jgi:hypothetical protein
LLPHRLLQHQLLCHVIPFPHPTPSPPVYLLLWFEETHLAPKCRDTDYRASPIPIPRGVKEGRYGNRGVEGKRALLRTDLIHQHTTTRSHGTATLCQTNTRTPHALTFPRTTPVHRTYATADPPTPPLPPLSLSFQDGWSQKMRTFVIPALLGLALLAVGADAQKWKEKKYQPKCQVSAVSCVCDDDVPM